MSVQRHSRQEENAKAALPLRKDIASNLRDSFVGFKWGRDMLRGLGLSLVRAFLQSWGKDSGNQLRQAATYILSAFVFLIGDGLWKTSAALVRVYRERKQVAFREAIRVGMVLIAGWSLVAILCSWIAYASSPHFILWHGDIGGSSHKYHLKIGRALHYPTPNTAVFFEKLTLENSGAPSNVKHWELIVTLGSGEKLRGIPIIHTGSNWPITLPNVPPNQQSGNKVLYGENDLIFDRTEKIPVVAGHPVVGFAEFLVLGTRQEVVGTPGTKLSIVFQDKDGRENVSSEIVSAEEDTTMPPS